MADADTGTNLWHTISAAASAVEPDESRVGPGPQSRRRAAPVPFSAWQRGAAAQAARGNSGVITASILGGLAEASGTVATLDGPGLRRGLRAAADRAAAAVAEPVDGTILTVIRAAADAAPEDPSVAVVAQAAAVARPGPCAAPATNWRC